jgi:DNA-binding GntR family transcriptional regulator
MASQQPSSSTTYSKIHVFETLVEEILSNRYKPGEPLVERALAERFGLSRTPIREVLRRLESEFLVTVQPNAGVFVRRLTPKDVREIFEVRQALEPMAASLAAENRPDADVAAFGWRFSLVNRPTVADALTELGQRFHDSVVAWSDNALLGDLYSIVRKQTRLVRTVTQASMQVEMTSFDEHSAIYDAIVRQDADVAKHRMLEHLRRTHDVVLEMIDHTQ